MKNLSGKHAVITGVGSGIGKALAKLLASKGCHLSLNELNPERLEETINACKEINPNIQIYSESFDVSKEEDMHKFAQNTINELGHVDIMINNAGVAIGIVRAEELKKKDFDWVMGINFWGMVYGTQAFVPHLKSRSEAAIVNVSSLFGLVGIAYQAAYCTTKFAIRGFTESVRMEVLNDAPQLIVHTVHPGGIATNIANDSKWVLDTKENKAKTEEMGKLLVMPPPKAAAIIVKAIEKKKHRIVIGNDAWQADWLQRIWPERYSKVLWKKFNEIATFQEMLDDQKD